MSNYQRFISYLQMCGGEEKGKPVGFAKVEVREGRFRLEVRAKGLFQGAAGAESVQVFLTDRKGDKDLLGRFVLSKGGGNFSYDRELSRMSGPPEDWMGLFLEGEGGLCCSCYWKEPPQVAEEQKSAKKKIEASNASGTQNLVPAQSVMKASAKEVTQSPAKADDSLKSKEEAEGQANIREKSTKLSIEAPAEVPAAVSLAGVEKIGDGRASEIAEKGREERTEPDLPETPEGVAENMGAFAAEGLWDLCYKLYPKMQPAPGQEGWQLLEIQLEDIGRLPRQNWIYGNNSFVVQGFYRHRHLLLAREKGKEAIWLGVPGRDGESDRLLAGLFGFRHFLPGNRRRSEGMGYWCLEIETDSGEMPGPKRV